MMTDGDVSARERSESYPASGNSLRHRLPGHLAIEGLLAAQSSLPKRALVPRVLGKTPLTAETRALFHDAMGEVHVGEVLESLGNRWVVLHSVPVGTDDVDHLVIGPGGVFIVTSRNHTKQNVWASQRTLMVGGVRHPDIRNMEYEMGRVERLLSSATGRGVEVSGILAVVAPKSLTVRQKHRDVEVLSADQIVDWLHHRSEVLTGDEVTAIAAAADRSTTWHLEPAASVDVVDLGARFESLRSEVARAWRLQLGWAITITVLVAGAFLGVTHTILLRSLGLL